ncbi:MAG: Crp/Fnr family transcriptional regulator [Clostridia bacterium]|nr:Crp/Fnr family transcriptional regulator [Clostridia bacterium]
MKKYLHVLKKCPLFSDIEEEDLLRMLVCLGAKTEYFDKKYTVFQEGSPAKYIGIVLSGSVQIIQVDFDGNRSILGEVTASEVFAEAFACAEVSALPVSVIVNEPGEIMLINCSHILHTCSNNCGFHQQLIFNLMKDLALKTIFFHQRIEITSKRTTREKLMAYLHLQAKKANSLSFEIPFDRQELADFLEVERSGLSSEIGKLKKEGVIQAEKKRFTLLCGD